MGVQYSSRKGCFDSRCVEDGLGILSDAEDQRAAKVVVLGVTSQGGVGSRYLGIYIPLS